MRLRMKFHMINTLQLKVRRKLVVIIRQLSLSKNMHLRLHWDGWTVGQAVDIDAVVRCEIWIDSVSEAPSLVVGVESDIIS